MRQKITLLLFTMLVLVCPTMQANAATQANEYAAVFDAQYYYNQYPDVQQVIGRDDQELLSHFMRWGMAEGRVGKEEFQIAIYLENYPELKKVFGTTNLSLYYKHYMQYGKQEGRIANGYCKDQKDVKNGAVAGAEETAKEEQAKLVTAPQLLVAYTTNYKTGTNRATNLELASGRLNELTLQPGEVFSFSTSVLPRTAANGYLMAPSFLGKEIVQSVGGGICQVSSTLYAALKSQGMPVIERHPHSLKVDYIPDGYDATIAEGIKDLRFENLGLKPIQIRTETKDGALTIAIYQYS